MRILMNRFMFLYKFFQSPKEVGSITPSSRYLTKKMFEHISWQQIDSIVELGAGTGVFTEVIHHKKRKKTTVVVIDFDINKVDCIVSGLPFTNFPREIREQIIEDVIRNLRPGGQFITFQYSPQIKEILKDHFSEVKVEFIPFNIHPAFIFRCKL